MNISGAELRQVLYCCSAELRARARGKPPGVQPWLTNLVRRLELEIAVSESGHESETEATHLNHDKQISAREAAAILGLSKRQTQRLAADLDGRIVDGRWVFWESVVRDYGEALTNGRSTA